MKRRMIQIEETCASLLADDEFTDIAVRNMITQRKLIKDYIRGHRDFLHSLKPITVSGNAPEIIHRMADASSLVGVGPMACVAGAIAQYSVEAMISAGSVSCIVDNGGDIALYINTETTVGIFTGSSPIRDIGFDVKPRKKPFGICTSSGTVGHSLSFGRADAAVVIACDAIFADATATALCNGVTSADPGLISGHMEHLMLDGIEGMLVIIDDLLLTCGDIPDIVPASVDINKISKGIAI